MSIHELRDMLERAQESENNIQCFFYHRDAEKYEVSADDLEAYERVIMQMRQFIEGIELS